jgi:hypothetical protein
MLLRGLADVLVRLVSLHIAQIAVMPVDPLSQMRSACGTVG